MSHARDRGAAGHRYLPPLAVLLPPRCGRGLGDSVEEGTRRLAWGGIEWIHRVGVARAIWWMSQTCADGERPAAGRVDQIWVLV